MAVENITLNLIPTGDIPSIHVAQFDKDRHFTVTLKEGEDDFTPTGYDIELQVRKVDSNIVTAVPSQTNGNVVTFDTTEQMTACSGTNLAELQLTKNDQTFATLHFYIVVQRDVLAGGLTSQSEIYDLEEQIAAIVPSVIGDEYYTAEEVDEKIAEIPTFDPTNYYDKTQVYTKTETNGLLSTKANTSALSTVAFSGSYTDLTNKPTIPDVSNYYTKSETYNQTEVNNLLSTKADTSSLSTVATTGDYDDLLNKPTIPAAQVQSDWSQSDNTKVDYIKNKPTIPTVQVFNRTDVLLNADGGTMRGFGSAMITLCDGIARIDFNILISVDETVTGIGSWGINRDYLTALTGKTITPVAGGVVTYYNNEQIYTSRMDFGGTFQVTSQFWKPARVYDDNGTKKVGGWSSSTFASGQRLIGTCYGTYT